MRLKLPVLTFSTAFALVLAPAAITAEKKIETVPAKETAAGEKPAAPGNPASTEAKKGEAGGKANKPTNFRGKISAVDKSAKTFTIQGKKKARTFHVSDESKLMKGTAPATFADIVEGEEVRGSLKRDEAGKLHALTVNVGAKAGGAGKADDKPAAKPGKVKDAAAAKEDKTEPNAPKP